MAAGPKVGERGWFGRTYLGSIGGTWEAKGHERTQEWDAEKLAGEETLRVGYT